MRVNCCKPKYSYLILALMMILLTVSCSVNMSKMQKAAANGIKKQDVSIWEKHLKDEKLSDDMKIGLIQELSKKQYASPFINDYLVNHLLPRYRGNERFEDKIIEGIVQQERLENVPLLISLIKDKHRQTELLKNTVAGFNIDGFHLWKNEIPTASGVWRDDLIDILSKLPNMANKELMSIYLDNPDKRDQLLVYLLHFESETVTTVNDLLLNEGISDFTDISKIINQIGSKQLINYIDVFYSDSEKTIGILEAIFSNFGDEALITLDLIQPRLTELSARLALYKVCEVIDSARSYKLIEQFLDNTTMAIEKKEIIIHMANMTSSFPPSFIPLLDRPDVNPYVIETLEKFMKTDPGSVDLAFRMASNVGKNVLLKTMVYDEKAPETLVAQIFDKTDQLDDRVKEYLMYCLGQKVYRNYYYDLVTYCLLSPDNSLYTPAVSYSQNNPAVFNDFVIRNYQQLTSHSTEKTIEFISYFRNTKNTDNLSFIFSKYLENFGNNAILAHQYGMTFINNSNVNLILDILNAEYRDNQQENLSNEAQRRVDSFIYLLSLSNNADLNKRSVIKDRISNYYCHLPLEMKLSVIDFATKSNNKGVLSFLFYQYKDMMNLERRILNSSLNYYATEDILPHLKRITYLLNDADFQVVKDLIYKRYTAEDLDDQLLKLFVFYYFRTNQFEIAESYINLLSSQTDDIKKVNEAIKYWRLGEEFSNHYHEAFRINPLNVAYAYKDLVEATLVNDYMLQHNPYHEDAPLYQSLKQNYDEQYELLTNRYKAYLHRLESSHDKALQRNFLVSLLNTRYSYEYKLGNKEYKAKDGQIYLLIEVAIDNVHGKDALMDFRSFAVHSENGVYSPLRQTLDYMRFQGNDVNYVQNIRASKTAVLSLLYEVPLSDERLRLEYNNEWLPSVSTPLILPARRQDTFRF